MGKSKKKQTSKAGNQAGKAGQHQSTCEKSSQKKPRGDGKPKRAKQEDHLEHIPFRLREIMKSKDRMKKRPQKNKKLKKAINSHHKSDDSQDGDIRVPHFKRGNLESERAYLQRMNTETQHVLFLTKNQVDRRPELDVDKQERRADIGKSDKKKEYAKVRLLKRQQKKLDRQEDKLEKEEFVDDIPFGEVTMAPPLLSVKPKKALDKSQNASKTLLLSSLLGQTATSTNKPSMARQRIMEEERQRAVEAYRYLKKRKQQQLEARTASLGKHQNFSEG
ncbi:coiled-coil domain-containing protein 137 [Mugil cephalus]|uniref:coiled-coil domain-containing protein 137 n=1 Tax=Mugil cephalus TaxID=48193 RepID=UPI001FB782C9|nr:coiled-coil domain-containing protein 137 [Mugil cephalus]